MPEISVILPARNEVNALTQLLPELRQVMDSQGLSYEVIVIDDGSSDGTVGLLENLSIEWPELSAVVLWKNSGQTAALQAGFDQACGNVIVTLDADGQNDPQDIPRLLTHLQEGYDLVSGWRINRQDSGFSKRLPSKYANKFIRFWSGSHLNDQGCGLKAYRTELLKGLKIYGEQHRYIAVLAEGLGAQVGEVTVNHRPRTTGKSHYGWGRVPKVLLDLLFLKYILSFSYRPLHLFGGCGLTTGIIGTILCTWITFEKFVWGKPAADRPLLLLGVLMILMGAILISFGILAELLVRSYHEVSGRPIYRIRRVLTNEKQP